MLEKREVSASIREISYEVGTARSCPQGEVLSPLLWSMPVDNLLNDLNNKGYNDIGYADYIAVTIRGKHDVFLGNIMQTFPSYK